MFYFFILSLALSTAAYAESISLDGVQMNVVKTADCGVVNHETVFSFSQNDSIVTAEYQGGKIAKGFLVGKFLTEDRLEFSYCQMQLDGKLDNGVSTCEVGYSLDGKITLTEHFEWKSRPGEFGTNVFEELTPKEIDQIIGLDLSVGALFPNISDPSNDPKCLIVAEVIQQIAQKADMSGVTQKELQESAEERYVFISEPERLSLEDADHRAFVLYQKGVTAETALNFYSFRLSDADIKRWTVWLD